MGMGNDYGRNFRAQKVDVHKFSMVPKPEIPRSSFRMQSQHKTTIAAGNLFPVFIQEVLPGDSFSVHLTAFVRMQTPIVPIMDNIDLESWFFFVPCRIIWSHWVNFMGEQPSTPTDSISYSIPQIVSPVGGFAAFGIYDYMGIPGVGQIGGGNTLSVNALPLRAYNLIWNQWFRDQNIDNAVGFGATNTVNDFGDGPDPQTNYSIQPLNKRHDYFTSCLPWTQKGGVAITLPLGSSATVKTSASTLFTGAQSAVSMTNVSGAAITVGGTVGSTAAGLQGIYNGSPGTLNENIYFNNLYADLSTATAATINQLRLSFQTQKLLERDARSGTRYQELVFSHFGVMGHDSRYQRPEYLGGGKSPVNIVPVPQTSATGLTGGSTNLGNLSAIGMATAHAHGFRQSFTEHGYILGLVGFRADQVYQQGLRRLWTRSTRYDFFWPVFSMLGEQAVRNDEIYVVGTPAQDTAAFGFQEHWAEYRYFPSMVSGAFRSTVAAPIDYWHLAVKFSALPALNPTFLNEPLGTTLNRVLAGGAAVQQEQFLCDFFFDIHAARPMPMYSVPGLIDHF